MPRPASSRRLDGARQHLDGTVSAHNLGPYAHRVAHGRLSLDGTPYRLTTQENGHCLHGGTDGFDTRLWEAESVPTPEWTGVLLRLRSPDGDQGFPGNLDVAVACLVGRDDELAFSSTAVTDAPTLVNLTNHAYLNLDGLPRPAAVLRAVRPAGRAPARAGDPAPPRRPEPPG